MYGITLTKDDPNPHNCFRFKELAELRAKQREAEDELFNIWESLVGDWRPDWSDINEPKWYLSFQWGERIGAYVAYTVTKQPPYRFFPTEELARRQYELASDHARAYMRGEF